MLISMGQKNFRFQEICGWVENTSKQSDERNSMSTSMLGCCLGLWKSSSRSRYPAWVWIYQKRKTCLSSGEFICSSYPALSAKNCTPKRRLLNEAGNVCPGRETHSELGENQAIDAVHAGLCLTSFTPHCTGRYRVKQSQTRVAGFISRSQ